MTLSVIFLEENDTLPNLGKGTEILEPV